MVEEDEKFKALDERSQKFVWEYELAVDFYKQMVEDLGKERALEIVKKALMKKQMKEAEKWKKEAGGNSFQEFVEWYKNKNKGKENVEILEITDKAVKTKIKKCSAAEAFAYLGVPEVCQAYCATDFELIKAFNPKMKLVRTKTLADGDDCCDHIWALENYGKI